MGNQKSREELDNEFEEQKRLFLLIPWEDLLQYQGGWVASKDGRIVDSDNELAELTRRFFDTFGDTAVYMAWVGKTPGELKKVNIPSFRIRRVK